MSVSTGIGSESPEGYLARSAPYSLVSLYSGAGGLDLGLRGAGFRTLFANDIDPAAVETHNKLFGEDAAVAADIRTARVAMRLGEFAGTEVDLVAGGPPCQGFSVAGKMDPDDPRSRHVLDFMGVVRLVRPRAFVMENVKALAVNRRWSGTRNDLIRIGEELGYRTDLILLNASHFGVPQARERMFLVGTRDGHPVVPKPTSADAPPSVREALRDLPGYGEPGNDSLCTARVTPARKPVMRRSPFAGMLFNGQGRPLDLDRPAATLPATMGGNRTPIIDQENLEFGTEHWVIGYHAHLEAGGEPVATVPGRLRRLTVEEAAAVQTFPAGMYWAGRQGTQYRQIGNAVPPRLALHLGTAVVEALEGRSEEPSPEWQDVYGVGVGGGQSSKRAA